MERDLSLRAPFRNFYILFSAPHVSRARIAQARSREAHRKSIPGSPEGFEGKGFARNGDNHLRPHHYGSLKASQRSGGLQTPAGDPLRSERLDVRHREWRRDRMRPLHERRSVELRDCK